MRSIRNIVRLIGRLGRDPEIRNLPNGKQQVILSIATIDSYRDQMGKTVTDIQWHIAIAWGSLVPFIKNNLKKGNEVVIEGRLIHREFEISTGEMRIASEISINDLFIFNHKT